MQFVRESVLRGRPPCSEVSQGSVLQHFLYKSRSNVQFIMPPFEPGFADHVSRRKWVIPKPSAAGADRSFRLLNIYTQLHSAMHSRPTSPKVLYCSTANYLSLAWMTPTFEMYALAPATASRGELSQAANKLAQYARREEERVFIIGGAVF